MAKDTPSTAVTPSNRLETPSKERNDIAGGDGNHAPPGSSSPRRRFLQGLEKRHQCRAAGGRQSLAPVARAGSLPAVARDRLLQRRRPPVLQRVPGVPQGAP